VFELFKIIFIYCLRKIVCKERIDLKHIFYIILIEISLTQQIEYIKFGKNIEVKVQDLLMMLAFII